MEFKCKVNSPECGELFSTECEVFNHFKIVHKLKERNDEFPCPKNNNCDKQFLQVRSAKNHAKKCISMRYEFFAMISFVRL